MSFCNGNSFNGNSACAAADDAKVRTLPWLFRVLIPGYAGGWPA